MKRITVLLVDDHMVVREGLRKLLELEPDLEVIGEAREGRQGIMLAKKLRPDVVLMDIAMPRLNGLEASRQVLNALPTTKVVILSAYSDEAYVARSTGSGAVGFLLKQTSAHNVCRAIREVQKGNTFFSPVISKRLRQKNKLDRNGLPRDQTVRLSSREMEVLQLVAEGSANKEIALELNISMKTVEKHREHVMEKLDIHDTAGLTRYAMSTGVIENSVRLTMV